MGTEIFLPVCNEIGGLQLSRLPVNVLFGYRNVGLDYNLMKRYRYL
jgi:hypothetical protein